MYFLFQQVTVMVEFSLPKNSVVLKGTKVCEAKGAKNKRTFSIYRWNPEDEKNPHMDEYEIAGRADLHQEQHRFHAHLPPLLPRGDLRVLRDEYRRHQHLGLYQGD